MAKHILSKAKNGLPGRIVVIYLCLPVTSLGLMLTVVYSGVDFQGKPVQRILMTMFIMLMLLGNILIYYSYMKYSREVYENSNQQLIIEKQRNELERVQEDIKRNEKLMEMVHDAGNYMAAIRTLVVADEKVRALDLMAELNLELEKSAISNYSDSMVLNALISEKKALADRQGVRMDVIVEPHVRLEHIKDIDLISMTGNLLDNAIRGAGERRDKGEVRLRIFMEVEGEVLVFKVENDCLETMEDGVPELRSTKEEKGIHGLGVKSVLHTAEKYGGNLQYYIENHRFIAVLLLPAEAATL